MASCGAIEAILGPQVASEPASNVGRRLNDFITTAKSSKVPVQVLYRPYLSTDLTQPQMNPPLVLFLKDIQVVAAQVVGRATFMDVANKRAPSLLYTRSQFPSLG